MSQMQQLDRTQDLFTSVRLYLFCKIAGYGSIAALWLLSGVCLNVFFDCSKEDFLARDENISIP